MNGLCVCAVTKENVRMCVAEYNVAVFVYRCVHVCVYVFVHRCVHV